MRILAIGIVAFGLLGGPAAAQISGAVTVQPPSWQKPLSPRKAMANDDAKARGRAAFLAGKTPEALVAEIRANHPSGGDAIVATALKEARTTGKGQIDLLNQMADADAQQLQVAMDRLSKFEATLSNLLRKMSETPDAITSNLK